MNEMSSFANVPLPYSYRVDDYCLLGSSGTFDRYAKTELIEGVIVAVNAQFTRHAKMQKHFYDALNEACRGSDLAVYFELSVLIDDSNMPQPDLVLARNAPDDGPLPAKNLAVVIEISGSTLDTDMGVKKSLYARSGIPEYWVVDLDGRKVRQFWSPKGSDYAQQSEVLSGDMISITSGANFGISVPL